MNLSPPVTLPDAIIDELLMGVCLMVSGENFQSYKCEHPSYIDEMEEPMLDRKELIDFSGDGSTCCSCCGEPGGDSKGAV